MLPEFDHARDLAGSEFAVKRFENLSGIKTEVKAWVKS